MRFIALVLAVLGFITSPLFFPEWWAAHRQTYGVGLCALHGLITGGCAAVVCLSITRRPRQY